MSNRTPEIDPAITPEAMRELFRFERSRILLTAYQLGIFTELGDASKESQEVAASIGADRRALDRLMNALCAVGVLVKQQGKFRNSEAASRLLVKGKPGYMAGLMHTVHLWDSWSMLTDAVRQGTRTPGRGQGARSQEQLEAFIGAMHANGRARAPRVVSLLDINGVSRLIDVGGGSGAYSMAFARANPALRATVFDLPSVLPLTRRYIEAEGLQDRVDTAAGDYLTDSLGRGFDLAFLSMVIHSNSPAENRALFQSVAQALNASGRMVVQDYVMDEDRVGPPNGALFALNMLVNTEAGDTYTESEVCAWMKEAGFGAIQRIDTKYETSLLIGRKAPFDAGGLGDTPRQGD